jgi:predicted DNA-binding transcriptional regulator YafY
MEGRALHGVETGFTLPELCALYMSRNLLDAVAAPPFQRDLALAFSRIEKLLSPRLRDFLDRLPAVLVAKPGPRGTDRAASEVVARLLEATIHRRVIRMRYHSVSSGGLKEYTAHPYRLAFANGGLYLIAYVPAYEGIRTFAVDRISSASLEKETFTPGPSADGEVFANSLGVFTGPPSPVTIEFAREVAPYVRARVWHPSQEIRDRDDGSIVLSMNVSHDWALRSWILGWGRFARILEPAALAGELRADLLAASEQYVGS